MQLRNQLHRAAAMPATILALALPFCTLTASPAPAQEIADEAFFETLNVDVVNVEVFVSDDDGNPVTGLHRDDFLLFEDGKEVDVANFYAVEDGQPVIATPPAGPPAGDAGPVRELPAITSPGPAEQPLHLVVYVDNLFIEPFSRQRALRSTRAFLAEHLGPDDRVMVVTSERALHVRQTFTSDRALVHQALAEIDEMSGLGVQGGSERDRTARLIDDSGSYSEAFQLADFFAKETFADLGRSIDTLHELLDLLAGLPGRTAILHVSDGLPMVAAADLFLMVQSKYNKQAGAGAPTLQYDARHRFRQLAATANSRGTTFYTLEAAGLRSHRSLSAEHRSGFSGSRIDIDLTRDFNRQEPLQLLATETGGRAAINTNNLDGFLDRVADDFRSYYSLGFTPPGAGDGRLHALEVKLRDRRDLTVRHRAAYRDRGPGDKFVDSVLATLRYGRQRDAGETSTLDVELELSTARATEGLWAVPFQASVPFAEVTLLPRGTPDGVTHQGRLELVVVAIDEAGESSLPQRIPLPLAVPGEHLQAVLEERVIYGAELQMRTGVHYVAVGIRDALSGRTGIARRGLRLGSGDS